MSIICTNSIFLFRKKKKIFPFHRVTHDFSSDNKRNRPETSMNMHCPEKEESRYFGNWDNFRQNYIVPKSIFQNTQREATWIELT